MSALARLQEQDANIGPIFLNLAYDVPCKERSASDETNMLLDRRFWLCLGVDGILSIAVTITDRGDDGDGITPGGERKDRAWHAQTGSSGVLQNSGTVAEARLLARHDGRCEDMGGPMRELPAGQNDVLMPFSPQELPACRMPLASVGH